MHDERRYLCCICGRFISGPRFKQHLAAHDRQGAARATVDREWHKYIDAIEAVRR